MEYNKNMIFVRRKENAWMEKGKLGVRLTAWPVIAFTLALFGQTLLCGLLLGIVMYVEKEEQVSRQCMTALFLSLAWKVIALLGAVLLLFSGFAASIFYYRAGEALAGLTVLVVGALVVVMVVFTIMGLMNVSKGREAGVPILSGLADRAFGFVKPRPQPQYPPQGYYPPGGQGPAPGQPYPGGQGYAPQPYDSRPAGGPPPPPPPPIAYPEGNPLNNPAPDGEDKPHDEKPDGESKPDAPAGDTE